MADQKQLPFASRLTAAAGASGISAIVTNPLEVLKVCEPPRVSLKSQHTDKDIEHVVYPVVLLASSSLSGRRVRAAITTHTPTTAAELRRERASCGAAITSHEHCLPSVRRSFKLRHARACSRMACRSRLRSLAWSITSPISL